MNDSRRSAESRARDLLNSRLQLGDNGGEVKPGDVAPEMKRKGTVEKSACVRLDDGRRRLEIGERLLDDVSSQELMGKDPGMSVSCRFHGVSRRDVTCSRADTLLPVCNDVKMFDVELP